MVAALASSIVSVISARIILSYASEASFKINVSGIYLFLLQCSVYCALLRINVAIVGQSHAPSSPWEHILRRVSLQSFVFWTVLLAVPGARHLKIHATFLIIGTIRAVYYFLLFTLVCGIKDQS